jgi:hypothetical protein
MGQIQDHTALLAPSFLGADPWSILYEPCPDVKQLSPGSSLEWTWDQSTCYGFSLWRWLVQFRMILSIILNWKRREASSFKRQASSLTSLKLYCIGL